MSNKNNTVKNNTVKPVKTVKTVNTVKTVEVVDVMSWRQAKALIKWGASSNGLKLNIGEIKVTAKDTKQATAFVNGFSKPNEAMIPGIAFWVAASKIMTSLGLTKKNAGMILDGRLKPETMIKRCGLDGDVLSLKFAPVAKESAFKPVAQVAPVAPVAQPAAGMAFFVPQETVSPVGATGSDAKAKIKRLMSAGFTVDEAMAMVGV
jgi:hypothetical protein